MKKLLPFLLLFATFSCSDPMERGEKVTTELVDLEISNRSSTVFDIWLMATNASGEILDVKHWQGEAHLVLSADLYSGETINIIMLTTFPAGDAYKQDLQIYSFVEPGRKWQIGAEFDGSGDFLPTVGSYSVNFLKIPDDGGTLTGITGFFRKMVTGSMTSCSSNGSTANCDGSFSYHLPGKVLFTRAGEVTTPMYFETDTLKAGNSYIYNFNEVFKPFENIIELEQTEIPSSQLVYLSGVTQGRQHIQANEYRAWFEELPTLRYGYVNGYEKYLAYFFRRTGKKEFFWNLYKPSLTSADFAIPSSDFTILNESFDDFNFSVELERPLAYQCSEWTRTWLNDDKTIITFVDLFGRSVKGKSVIKDLPEEVIAMYPELKSLSSFEYSNSYFSFTDEDPNYGLAIDRMFEEPQDFRAYSFFNISKNK